VDVIGVGYADGTIRIYDIKQAELVMQMKMDEGGVTQLSFRMGAFGQRTLVADFLDGPPILASGSTAGTFAVWDLSKGGRLIHVQRGAHEQAVTGLQFVQGQPLLVTSSGDNNIKVCPFRRFSGPRSLLAMAFRNAH
jgi:U3 small nucleolar RNA-associated protein 21